MTRLRDYLSAWLLMWHARRRAIAATRKRFATSPENGSTSGSDQ